MIILVLKMNTKDVLTNCYLVSKLFCGKSCLPDVTVIICWYTFSCIPRSERYPSPISFQQDFPEGNLISQKEILFGSLGKLAELPFLYMQNGNSESSQDMLRIMKWVWHHHGENTGSVLIFLAKWFLKFLLLVAIFKINFHLFFIFATQSHWQNSPMSFHTVLDNGFALSFWDQGVWPFQQKNISCQF